MTRLSHLKHLYDTLCLHALDGSTFLSKIKSNSYALAIIPNLLLIFQQRDQHDASFDHPLNR